MLVETYTEKRREEVIRLIKEFYVESLKEYGQVFEEDALQETIEKNREHSFLLIVDGVCQGLIAGNEVKTPYSSEKVFHEMIWFVSKSHRLKGVFLLNRTLETLKRDGFTSIIMTLMHNSGAQKMQKLYHRLGFMPFETHFIKKL